MPEAVFISTSELMDTLGVSRATTKKWKNKGLKQVPPELTPSKRKAFFYVSDLVKFIKSMKISQAKINRYLTKLGKIDQPKLMDNPEIADIINNVNGADPDFSLLSRIDNIDNLEISDIRKLAEYFKMKREQIAWRQEDELTLDKAEEYRRGLGDGKTVLQLLLAVAQEIGEDGAGKDSHAITQIAKAKITTACEHLAHGVRTDG